MSYIRKSKTNVAAAITIISIAAVAVWQFYLFVTFENAQGTAGAPGATHHLWWAVGIGLIACVASFLVFSFFARYDKDNEMHITS